MSPSLVALCGFAAWTVLLLVVVIGYRGLTMSRTGKAINTFSPAGTDLDPLGQRLTRAHLNCLETLPVIGAVILSAAVAGRADVTDALALPLLWARMGQSLVHAISTAPAMVMLRGALLTVQLVIVAIWLFRLL
jgi:uncharacterized MAPEG superfamily protein